MSDHDHAADARTGPLHEGPAHGDDAPSPSAQTGELGAPPADERASDFAPGPAGADANDSHADEAPRPGGLQETLRRVIIGGASALTTTEEGLKALLIERRLPKEALSALAQQTDQTRKEVGRLVGRELKRAASKVDIAGELRRALTGLRIDIKTSIRIRDDEAGKPTDAASASAPGEPKPKTS